MNKVVFSGIQPTGVVHLGNFLGAIANWVSLQNEAEASYFCLVDLHAITANNFDPKKLQKDIFQNLAIYLACGLDPKKAIIFQQSDVSAHSELEWILNIVTSTGELKRMTQYKEKGAGSDITNAGLFNYPILQAADILLYKANLVPVGEDQSQHLELARIIARRFNNRFGKIFIEPETYTTATKRVMALHNPHVKMSKSISSSFISLLDPPEIVKKRIEGAVTDSTKDASGAGGKNLMLLVESLAPQPIALKYKSAAQRNEISYSELKQDLISAINAFIAPIKDKSEKLINQQTMLENILSEGAKKANQTAKSTLEEVRKAIGMLNKRV